MYDKQYGTSFGFVKTTESTPPTGYTANDMIVRGIYTHGHSFRDYGLYPHEKPVIETPEIQKDEVEIPGRDGVLDLTESLDGMVHYLNRDAEFSFVATGGRKTWDTIYKRLKNDLHGRIKEIVVDEEPDGYYYGRLTVEEPKYDDKRGIAIFTITGNLDPWKYDFTEDDGEWLWDPFSFIDGVIPNHKEYTLTSQSTEADRTITIHGSRMPVVPDIYVSSGSLSVLYDGISTPIALSVGSNLDKTPDLILQDESKTLTFKGDGTFRIKYKVGCL